MSKALRALSEDEIYSLAPAALNNQPHPKMSRLYQSVKTMDVVNVFNDHGYVVTDAQQVRTKVAANAPFAKHVLVLTGETLLNETGRGEIPQILLTNSHNGSTSLRMNGGFYRFVCANGLVIGDDLHSVGLMHEFGSIFRRQLNEAIPTIAEILDGKVSVIADWKARELKKVEQTKFADQANLIRHYGDKDRLQMYKAQDFLKAEREEDKGDDLWSVFNRVQEKIINGGVQGETANQKVVTLRKINDAGRQIEINQALWNEAAKLAA